MTMNCDQFRQNLEDSLRYTSGLTISEEMREHLAMCHDCQAYEKSLLALHAALLEIPLQKLPEGLTARLKVIGESPQVQPKQLGWMPELRRGAVLMGLAVAMVAAYFLPPLPGTIVRFAVLTAGLTTFISNVLKPAFTRRNLGG